MKKIFKRLLIIVVLSTFCIISSSNTANADSNLKVKWFNIMPEISAEDTAELNTKITDIWSEWWHVWEKYNKSAKELWDNEKTDSQVASWIMNWDTVMNYLVFIVQFLSQLGLVVWAAFIMYAGYKYIVSLFEWWKVPSATVKNAIIWILVIIFSYAIMRILTSFIWLT